MSEPDACRGSPLSSSATTHLPAVLSLAHTEILTGLRSVRERHDALNHATMQKFAPEATLANAGRRHVLSDNIFAALA